MIRSSMPKSEALYSRTVCKDGGICASTCCTESGDDLDPFFIGFGRGEWVGVDGSLTGAFFSLRSLLAKAVKKKNKCLIVDCTLCSTLLKIASVVSSLVSRELNPTWRELMRVRLGGLYCDSLTAALHDNT